MRFTFVINDLTVGGAQRLFIDIANKLSLRGYDVTIISLSVVPNRLSLLDSINESVSVVQLNFHHAFVLSEWIKFAKVLRARRKSTVFSTLFLANFVTRMTIFLHRSKVVVVEQNTYDEKVRVHIFLDWLLSYVTQTIVCTSQSVLNFTAAQEGIRKDLFTVIHSGIDIKKLQAQATSEDRTVVRTEYAIPDSAVVFLNVARLTGQKGHALLFDSFRMLLSQSNGKEYYLLLVGEGGLRPELEAQVSRLNLHGRVFFVGARHDVPRFYVAADYFISTSRIEGFSLVHAEALAFGLPIVTTRTAGPDVMVQEGQNGFFVEHDPESVLIGCQRLLASDYKSFSESARKRAEDFSIEKTVSAYESLAKKLL